MVSINPLKQKKTMKKYIFMAVAGMLALSSCSNDDNDQTTENAPRQMTFTAGFGDGATTRATLSGKSVTFDAPDYISIFSANNSNVQFTTTAGGASATFSGMATAGDPTYYAVYPYKDSYTFSGDVISGIVIPSNQSNAVDGWDKEAPIAYATTTGSSLTFHNACALLKIVNDWEDDVDISVKAFPMDEIALTGTFNLDTNTGALTATMGNYEVLADDVPKGKTIYLAVAPFTTTGRFMAQGIDNSDNTHRKMKNDGVTLEAGKIYDLGKVSEWP